MLRGSKVQAFLLTVIVFTGMSLSALAQDNNNQGNPPNNNTSSTTDSNSTSGSSTPNATTNDQNYPAQQATTPANTAGTANDQNSADRRVVNGTISGTVADNSGRPIPGATVQVENVDTGFKYTRITDANGNFSFTNVPVGRNRIMVAGDTANIRDLDLTASGMNDVRLTTMATGTAPTTGTATPTPTTGTATTTTTTNTTTGTTGNTATNQNGNGVITDVNAPVTTHRADQLFHDFETRQVHQLNQPNFRSRNGESAGPYNLGLLSEGMASTPDGPVYSGTTPGSNNFHVDGIDNNNRLLQRPSVYVSNEATTEMTLMQNQLQPAFGHSTGGEFNTITRTGTNQVHGQLYDYLQNQNMNARDVRFARSGFTGDPRYDQNRLGAAIGAPLIKDRLFFFGNFEYIPFGFNAMPFGGGMMLAPTASGYAALNGLRGISSSNLNLLSNSIGTANNATGFTTVNGVNVPVGPVNFLSKGWQNSYDGMGSIDWNAASTNTLHLRYVHNDIRSNNTGNALPNFVTPNNSRSFLASIADEARFTPNIINELRLGYTRMQTSYPGANGFSLANGTQFPNFSIWQDLNLNFGPYSGMFANSTMNNYHLADNVAVTWGRHEFRVGFDGRRNIDAINGFAGERGIYGYSTLSRFLGDLPPDVQSQRLFNGSELNGNHFDFFGYVTDRIKIRPSFTLDAGVRYEYVTIPNYMTNQGFNGLASIPGVLGFNGPSSQTNAFAPKIGFAWSPTQLHGTVFRAGFGMNYDSLYANSMLFPGFPMTGATAFGNLASNTPGFLANGGLQNQFANVNTNNLTTAQARAMTGAWYQDQKLPYAMQWNAALEQQLGHSFTLELKYLGTAMRHLPVLQDINAPMAISPANSLQLFTSMPTQATLNALPVTLQSLQSARGPLAGFGFAGPLLTASSAGNSSYNALAIQLRRRFSAGFHFLGDYTWSHMIDDVVPGQIQSPNFRSVDRANSVYDRRHRVTITSLWEPASIFHNPGSVVHSVLADFSLGGTFTYQSPSYATPISGVEGGLYGLNYMNRAMINSNGTVGVGSGVTPLNNSFGQTVGYLVNNTNAQYIGGAAGVYANTPRNTLRLGQVNNFDMFAVKRFSVRDRFAVEVRGDAYNVFNHPQFTNTPVSGLFTPGLSAFSPLVNPASFGFGNYQNFLGNNPRLLQVALRLTF